MAPGALHPRVHVVCSRHATPPRLLLGFMPGLHACAGWTRPSAPTQIGQHSSKSAMTRCQSSADDAGKTVKVSEESTLLGCSRARLLLCCLCLHPAPPDATQRPSAVAETQLFANALASAARQGR